MKEEKFGGTKSEGVENSPDSSLRVSIWIFIREDEIACVFTRY